MYKVLIRNNGNDLEFYTDDWKKKIDSSLFKAENAGTTVEVTSTKNGHSLELLRIPAFEEALVAFIESAQKVAKYGKLSVNGKGGRYKRIVCTRAGDESGRYVYCFVDTRTGNVHKSASWKTPEKKNPRSNIFDSDHGISGVDHYGAKYLR